MQRRLILDTIENARDLGGCTIANGQQTRFRAFVRTDHFQAWSETTRQNLVDYGVKLVIDLRDPYEIKEAPNMFTDSQHVIYINMPIMGDEVHLSEQFQTLEDGLHEHFEMYQFFLDTCSTQIGKIFTTIATHNTTTLFHCHAGKDRTGVIAAILLSLAGVPDEAIAADYALTGEYLVDRFAQRRAAALERGEDMARFEIMHAYSPETMRKTLNHLRQRYGSIPDYLRASGVSDAHIAQLQTMLVETSTINP
jgi:protein-tyrosine phosphatase